MPNNNKNYPVCSFCGRTEQEVDHLIAGNGVFICDECIDLCCDILHDDYLDEEFDNCLDDETLTDEEREEYKKKEDELKERISNKSKDNKEEVTDPETGKKIKKVKHTGPRGGHYYINDNGEHIYLEERNESIKNMKIIPVGVQLLQAIIGPHYIVFPVIFV